VLHRSELWRDRSEAGMRDDFQPLLNRQTRSILGVLPTTPWEVLKSTSRRRPTPVILESIQQCIAVKLAKVCSINPRSLHQNPSSGILVCRAVKTQHKHGQTTVSLIWLAHGADSVVRTVILDDATVPNCISNHPSFRLKHLGVQDGSDGSDRTSYPLTENYIHPIAYSPPSLCAWYTHHRNDMCVTLFAGAAVML